MRFFRPVLRTLLLSAILAASAAATVHATVPSLLSQQGRILDGSDVPLAGAHSLTFTLYDGPAPADSALWTEVQALTFEDGIYAAELGSLTALTLPFDATYWLGIKVDGGAELAPRTRLTAVPYARRSANADAIADSIVTGAKLANGAAVRSLNGLTDDITLVAGSNVTINQSGSSISIDATAGGSGLSLPYEGTAASDTAAFHAKNAGAGMAGHFEISDSTSFATALKVESALGLGLRVETAVGDAISTLGDVSVSGDVTATTAGDAVTGHSTATGDGVSGIADSGEGVYGQSDSGDGVYGTSTSGDGVFGKSTNLRGVYAESDTKQGVYGKALPSSAITAAAKAGVVGDSQAGIGVQGLSDNAAGVHGESTNDVGVYARTAGKPGALPQPVAGALEAESNTVAGVSGYSTAQSGVYGITAGDPDAGAAHIRAGVTGESSTRPGVHGFSRDIDGVQGHSGAAGLVIAGLPAAGVLGSSNARDGVIGASDDATGVVGVAEGLPTVNEQPARGGVYGLADTEAAVVGVSETGAGVRGQSGDDHLPAAPANAAVLGISKDREGVAGYSKFSPGVFGESEELYGVMGYGPSDPEGNAGVSAVGNGVFAPGAPKAAALRIDDGAIIVAGTNRPAGKVSLGGFSPSVPIRSCDDACEGECLHSHTIGFSDDFDIENSLVKPSSVILVTIEAPGAPLGTQHTIEIIMVSPGVFRVRVAVFGFAFPQNCNPPSGPINVNYMVVNPLPEGM